MLASFQSRTSRRTSYRARIALALLVGFAFLLGAGCGGGKEDAESFPARQITLVVPFGPGGGTDTYARIFKQAIEQEKLLPVPLVVINQGGAGGTIGSRRVKDAAPDGYTMMVIHDAILTGKLAGQVDYGHEAFEPIAATSEVGMVIAVRKDGPYQSLNDLMQAAAESPDWCEAVPRRFHASAFSGSSFSAFSYSAIASASRPSR